MCLPLCLDFLCLLQMLYFLLWSSPGKSSLSLGTLTCSLSITSLFSFHGTASSGEAFNQFMQTPSARETWLVSLALDEKDFEFYHIKQNISFSSQLDHLAIWLSSFGVYLSSPFGSLLSRLRVSISPWLLGGRTLLLDSGYQSWCNRKLSLQPITLHLYVMGNNF